jgi:hypothetical protein
MSACYLLHVDDRRYWLGGLIHRTRDALAVRFAPLIERVNALIMKEI